MREKKTAPVRKASPGAKAPKGKFVVGAIWADRNGQEYEIVSTTSRNLGYPIRAKEKGDSYAFRFTGTGKWYSNTSRPNEYDLVREVKSPKGSAKPAGRSRNTKVTPGKRER